jgi:hypothetical protein
MAWLKCRAPVGAFALKAHSNFAVGFFCPSMVTAQADSSSTDFRRLPQITKQICENLCNLRMNTAVTQTQA